MNNKCDIIKDLLPLYAENMCSDDSRQAVAEHIAECESCRNELKKINTDVAIQADSDVSMFKRIKKRARIEKVVISIVSIVFVLSALWFAQFFLINTDCAMDYEKYNLAENVKVEVDEDGLLWLCTDNEASTYDYYYPMPVDANGIKMGEDGFDKNNKGSFNVTFHHRKVNELAMIQMPGQKKRTPLFNINEKEYKFVKYYDENTDTEYVLWERG
ncbi:MAG: zf-HC2 domain-containing protein [Ruminococcus sp.]|nr:zf-HC2 domain-containing protein [Ruminococcus sp.]